MRAPSLLALGMLLLAAPALPQTGRGPDPRHLSNGFPIPGESYCDQPYVVRTQDGAWLCVMTTAPGKEGASGQHIIAVRSADHGRTWSKPVDVEPPGPPEASYAVLLRAPYGRIYCFYNYNSDHIGEVKRDDAGVYTRVDTLGHYVFKYSDDGGRSWSAKRYEVPVREFEVDRKNVYGGKVRFFWNVGRPLLLPDAALLVLHKVGGFGVGFMRHSEGVFMKSRNLLTERDPARILWETLPVGDAGLRAPAGGGIIAEEQSVVRLSDGSLYCVYRTVDGWPACSYSRDGGRTWSAPQYASYTPGGKRIKHPRAANFVWRCDNGKFLYWFHNHGGSAARNNPKWDPYADRNPAWIAAGEERDSPSGRVIVWSQPEILLYDDDPFIRMSYPDLIEEDGRFWVTETQKNLGRVHEIDPKLLNGLFGQLSNGSVAREGLVLDLKPNGPTTAPMPALPPFHERDNTRPDYGGKDLRAGFSLDFWLRPQSGQLLDTRTDAGQGIVVSCSENGSVHLVLNDGRQESTWSTTPGLLAPGKLHHVVLTVDGGPKIMTAVIDGVLDDGGDTRQFGWGRFSSTLRDVNGAATLRVGKGIERVRIYGRALRTSEAVGNFRAGVGG